MTKRASLILGSLAVERRRAGSVGKGRGVARHKHSKFTLLTLSRCILGEPCGVWQLTQPSTFTGSCSNTSGPRLSAWHVKHVASCAAGNAHLMRSYRAVRIVAIGALDQPFIHAMVEGHVELRFLLQMARKAKRGLRLHQQELLFRGMVG